MSALAAQLEALGLDDPTGAVSLAIDARQILHRRPPEPDAPGSDEDLVTQARAAAASHVARDAFELEFRRRTEQHAVATLARAFQAAWEYGDRWITDLIRPEVAKVLAAAKKTRSVGLDERWTALHALARHVRNRGWAPRLEQVRGIAEYAFSDPSGPHFWTLNGSRQVEESARVSDGQTSWIRLKPTRGAPTIDLGVIVAHPEWGPGCYTAAEVLEHATAWTGVPAGIASAPVSVGQ